MRAILVSVDYADLLQVTLPRNRHHFTEVFVVTTPKDTQSQRVAEANDCVVVATDLFYSQGAIFNKWAALEYGLDVMGRQGWLCIMDADIVWPHEIPEYDLVIGNLYTPRRRMVHNATSSIPHESTWNQFPLHRNEEFAGWSQIFHADDPHLGNAPWHETNWKHAGGADSFFQMKWGHQHKIRPPFECLHLGPAGTNWCGRVSPYLDGTQEPEARQRYLTLMGFMHQRHAAPKDHKFDHEKIQ